MGEKLSINSGNKRRKRRKKEDYLEYVLKELKIGLEPRILRDNVVPHQTLYNILGQLEKYDVAYKDEENGKYYYTLKREREKFEEERRKVIEEYEFKINELENKIKRIVEIKIEEVAENLLKHSKLVVLGYLKLSRKYGWGLHVSDSILDDISKGLKVSEAYRVDDEVVEMAAQHLSTGYPEVFELVNKAIELKRVIEDKRVEIKDFLYKKVEKLEQSGKITHPFNVIELIFRSAEYKLKGYKKILVNFNEYTRKEYEKEVKELASKLESEIEGIVKEVLEIEDEYRSIAKEADKKLYDILLSVASGFPLKGTCKICEAMYPSELLKALNS